MKIYFLKLLILLIILNSTFVIVKAQLQGQSKIDSLLKELPKMKQDTNAVNLLEKLSFNYRGINPDEGIKFGNIGLELSKKQNWKKGKAICYYALSANFIVKSEFNLALELNKKALNIFDELGDKTSVASCLDNNGIIYDYQSSYTKALEFYHKSLKINKEIENKQGISTNLRNIGANYASQSNYSKALEHYNMAIKICEEIGDKQGIGANLNNIGTIYGYQSDYSKALEYFLKALDIFEKIDNKIWIANNLNNIAIMFLNQSNYHKALEYHVKALKIFEDLKNKSGIALSLGNIGEVFLYKLDYTKALDYYFKALKLFEEIGDKSNYGNQLIGIGSIYKATSNYPKALEYYNRSLKIFEDLGDKNREAINLSHIGIIYKDQSNYIKAMNYKKRALKTFMEIGNKYGVATNLANIGELYYELSKDSLLKKINETSNLNYFNKEFNLQTSVNYSLESLVIYNEIGDLNSISQVHENLSNAYLELGEFKKAYESLKLHKTYHDSIFNIEKQKEFANLDAKRENEIKDKEIKILHSERKAQQFQSYLLFGGIIVLFGAFTVALLRFREKKKLSDKLAHQKNEIESQKSLLEEKNTEIVDSINYAATIQNALLPWSSVLSKSFKEHFVIYKPKDIVSGDSYWFQEVDGIKYLAVIDCTGHGVPGSMLTVIANSVLDDAVLSKKLISTSEILTYMNEKVTEVLNQRLAENSIRDGMEVCLIAIHNNKIQFAGAGRPLFVKNGTLETFKTDKRGIAGQNDNDTYNFSSVEIEKTDNLVLYLSSDGYADQMNANSKKYSTKRFLETLDKISEMPLEKQKEILESEFNSHRGNREQIDDVTVIGVKL